MARTSAIATGVAPVLAAGAVLIGASPAVAAASGGSITAPNASVSSSGSFTVAATVKNEAKLGLYVQDPSGKQTKIATGGCGVISLGCTKTIAGSFNPGNVANRSYKVILKGEITGKTYDTKSFALNRAPATPSGLKASLRGASKVALTWAKGSEPDLTSYGVVTSGGNSLGTVSADRCSGGTCSATVGAPDSAAGERVGFGVRAYRASGGGSGTIKSGTSSMAYVKFPAAPKATTADKSAPNASVPKLTGKGGDKPLQLPPAGKAPKPSAADAPEPRLPAAADGQRVAATEQTWAGLPVTWAFSIAIGLILLLIAAHAGAWARRRFAAAADGSATAGTATAPPRSGRGGRRRMRRRRRPASKEPTSGTAESAEVPSTAGETKAAEKSTAPEKSTTPESPAAEGSAAEDSRAEGSAAEAPGGPESSPAVATSTAMGSSTATSSTAGEGSASQDGSAPANGAASEIP